MSGLCCPSCRAVALLRIRWAPLSSPFCGFRVARMYMGAVWGAQQGNACFEDQRCHMPLCLRVVKRCRFWAEVKEWPEAGDPSHIAFARAVQVENARLQPLPT